MTSLDNVLTNFAAAEQALRKLMEDSESLSTAEQRVDVAFTTLKDAGASLTDSRQKLDRSADHVMTLAKVLEDTAEQFRVAADALNQLNPAEIAEVGQETQAELHKLGTRLGQAISEADSTPAIEAAKVSILQTQTKLDELESRLGQAISEADSTPAIEAAKVSILQTQAEQAERMRTNVDGALSRLQDSTTALETAVLGIARRQTIVIAFSVVAAVLAAVAVVAVLLR